MASSKDTVIFNAADVITKKPMPRTRAPKSVAELAVEIAIADNIMSSSLVDDEINHAEKKRHPPRQKKPKLVRDSFTIPEVEYAQLTALKQRCLTAGISVKKSELLRAGLQALSQMADKHLFEQLEKLEKLKTGRPSHN